MKRLSALLFLILSFSSMAAFAQVEPDYSDWTRILKTYYDPAKGMDYAALKAKDRAAVTNLRNALGKVDANKLDPKARLAYWMNAYNINIVDLVLDNYPGFKSIRDLSTDPITRINVFKKDRVPLANGKMMSLKALEDDEIREKYKDPRIHFAINCAARSCPPMRPEAFTGAQVDAQLDDQVRKYMASNFTRVEKDGNGATITTTKIMSGFPWFGSDFEKWPPGGKAKFVRKYLPPAKLALLPANDNDIDFEFDDYNWALNDSKAK
jgi:hypothetical protein